MHTNPPHAMTTEERLDEIAQLLAVAIKRLKNREKMTIAQVELSGLQGREERSWN